MPVPHACAPTPPNPELPKFKGRTSKNLANKPFFKYKLFASYSYGYGFTPFLVHESQKEGANLLWTSIFLTIQAQYDKYRFMPKELWIQLDNTTKENKNETMRAMAAWLCATFKFQRVRVFFLLKGHTHVVIDQIFGVITTHIRKAELLAPSALVREIDAVLGPGSGNEVYDAVPVKFLHCLFDFDKMIEGIGGSTPLKGLCNRRGYSDMLGSFDGLHDFLFSACSNPEMHGAAGQHRTSSQADWWPSEAGEGASVLKRQPSTIPQVSLAGMNKRNSWEYKGSTSVRSTIHEVIAARAATEDIADMLRAEWENVLERIPNCVEELKEELKLVFKDLPSMAFAPEQGFGTAQDSEGRARPLWHYQLMDRVQNPEFEVATSDDAQYKTQLEKYMLFLHGSSQPTTEISGLYLTLGQMIIAKYAGTISLYKVKALYGMGQDINVQITGTLYAHDPQEGVPGLFGTFSEHRIPEAGMMVGRQANHSFGRGDILVGRASTLKYGSGTKKKTYLSLDTLRSLSVASAEHDMPREIPASHYNSSDSEDEDDSPMPPAARRKGRAQNRPSSKRPTKGASTSRSKRSHSYENTDDESVDDVDDEDPEDVDDEDPEDVDDEGDYEDGDEGGDKEDDEDDEEDDNEDDDEEGRSVPLPVPPCLAWVLVSEDLPEFKLHRVPVALVFVQSIEEKTQEAACYWYKADWKPDARGLPRKNTGCTYKRFWQSVSNSTPQKKSAKKRAAGQPKWKWDYDVIDTSSFIPFSPEYGDGVPVPDKRGLSIRSSMENYPDDPERWTYEDVTFCSAYMGRWARYMVEQGYALEK
jgi:hypothetical protein